MRRPSPWYSTTGDRREFSRWEPSASTACWAARYGRSQAATGDGGLACSRHGMRSKLRGERSGQRARCWPDGRGWLFALRPHGRARPTVLRRCFGRQVRGSRQDAAARVANGSGPARAITLECYNEARRFRKPADPKIPVILGSGFCPPNVSGLSCKSRAKRGFCQLQTVVGQ